jgi:hypothetical protein
VEIAMERRTAVSKDNPESKVRYLILNAKTGKPIIGNDSGISIKERAERLSDSYLMETVLTTYHEYHGLPNPDEEETEDA